MIRNLRRAIAVLLSTGYPIACGVGDYAIGFRASDPLFLLWLAVCALGGAVVGSVAPLLWVEDER